MNVVGLGQGADDIINGVEQNSSHSSPIRQVLREADEVVDKDVDVGQRP